MIPPKCISQVNGLINCILICINIYILNILINWIYFLCRLRRGAVSKLHISPHKKSRSLRDHSHHDHSNYDHTPHVHSKKNQLTSYSSKNQYTSYSSKNQLTSYSSKNQHTSYGSKNQHTSHDNKNPHSGFGRQLAKYQPAHQLNKQPPHQFNKQPAHQLRVKTLKPVGVVRLTSVPIRKYNYVTATISPNRHMLAQFSPNRSSLSQFTPSRSSLRKTQQVSTTNYVSEARTNYRKVDVKKRRNLVHSRVDHSSSERSLPSENGLGSGWGIRGSNGKLLSGSLSGARSSSINRIHSSTRSSELNSVSGASFIHNNERSNEQFYSEERRAYSQLYDQQSQYNMMHDGRENSAYDQQSNSAYDQQSKSAYDTQSQLYDQQSQPNMMHDRRGNGVYNGHLEGSYDWENVHPHYNHQHDGQRRNMKGTLDQSPRDEPCKGLCKGWDYFILHYFFIFLLFSFHTAIFYCTFSSEYYTF